MVERNLYLDGVVSNVQSFSDTLKYLSITKTD